MLPDSSGRPGKRASGFVGSLDENGFFAVIAARLKLRAGLIAEIEVVVARPERTAEWGNLGHATHTLFVPPLSIDLGPAGFAAVPPPFAAVPKGLSSRAELWALAECSLEADAPLARDFIGRENGVVEGSARRGH